ncbi:MAG: hypothetical protein KDA90_16525 [Planctomycetaceae bacterium]|nr:hypothetical protein [Planctomycetaceae bacterium]
MSKWISIVQQHREDFNLGAWGDIPESHYTLIAQQCGEQELAEIRQRLQALEQQAQDIPDWDGDSQDDIWRARRLFAAIISFHADRS